jgi:hypothetical protein
LRSRGDSAAQYRDSVWSVDLAAVQNPDVIGTEFATAFGLPEVGGRPAEDVLAEALSERELLLVVDNCEHLGRDVAVLLQRLLAVSPGLRVIATTREPFGVPGEWVYRVGVLGVPPAGTDDLEAVRGSESVRLFIERARAVKPGFALDAQNAGRRDHLPGVGRCAAGDRARGGADEIAPARSDRGPVARSVQVAAQPNGRPEAADAAGGDRVELRPVGARRAAGAAAAERVPWRGDAGRGGGGDRVRRGRY